MLFSYLLLCHLRFLLLLSLFVDLALAACQRLLTFRSVVFPNDLEHLLGIVGGYAGTDLAAFHRDLYELFLGFPVAVHVEPIVQVFWTHSPGMCDSVSVYHCYVLDIREEDRLRSRQWEVVLVD